MAEFASKGLAGAGLGTGIAGLSLGVLNGGLLNGFGTGAATKCVTKDELAMAQEIAVKDSRIAMLEAEKDFDAKLVEVYNAMNNKANAIMDKVNANKDEQAAINMQQAVYNGTNTSMLGCMQTQIAQLMSLTKLVVPNASVCPGWGNVTVSPATTTTP